MLVLLVRYMAALRSEICMYVDEQLRARQGV